MRSGKMKLQYPRLNTHWNVHILILTLKFLEVYSVVTIASTNEVYQQDVVDIGREQCQPDKLTVYKVILHTYWTREKFPKHYPDWRPPAQWSKLFGRSHDKSSKLFRIGEKSTSGMKEFAESGSTSILEKQTQGLHGVFDEFNATPIFTGSGRTEAEFFVDGNHSFVSLISRIVPSPDWFIGIDSFNLCVNGNWIDSITIEVEPLDAGTDNGFTFTAPNWRTDPQGIIYKITSRYPAHPAGSFYYPYKNRLPPIGTFQFLKVKEYELSEVFHHAEDDRQYEVLKTDQLTKNIINEDNGNNDIELAIEEEHEEQQNHKKQFRTAQVSFNKITKAFEKEINSNSTSRSNISSENNQYPKFIKRGDKLAIVNNVVDTYRQYSPSPINTDSKYYRKHRNHKSSNRMRYRRIKPPRDCRVSEWSQWSECSKSCGIGEMHRKREVVKHARRGGESCPPLFETKWCGSSSACPKNYFNW